MAHRSWVVAVAPRRSLGACWLCLLLVASGCAGSSEVTAELCSGAGASGGSGPERACRASGSPSTSGGGAPDRGGRARGGAGDGSSGAEASASPSRPVENAGPEMAGAGSRGAGGGSAADAVRPEAGGEGPAQGGGPSPQGEGDAGLPPLGGDGESADEGCGMPPPNGPQDVAGGEAAGGGGEAAGGEAAGGGGEAAGGEAAGGGGEAAGGAVSPSPSGRDAGSAAPSTGGASAPEGDAAAPADAGTASPEAGADATPGGQALGSAGCGVAEPLKSGRLSIDVGGVEREYVLDVPASYDSTHPYRLIFTWHWADAYAEDVVRGEPGPYGGLGPYYGLKALADETAIFVSPEGIEEAWFNEGGEDIAFLRAMLEHLNANLCVDQERIFTTGFSFGAMMSVAVGCEMGDVFRAAAPMAASIFSGCNEAKDAPIAYLGIHGAFDTNIDLELGYAARDIFVERNHCEPTVSSLAVGACVAFDGCESGKPVHWCEFEGDHTQWVGAPEIIWDFFARF